MYIMFVAAALVAACVVGRAASAATAPPPEKIYYDLKHAENLFEQFIAEHNKVYGTIEEHRRRFEIFKDSLREINRLNAAHPDTVFALYHFADRTDEEMFYSKPLNASEIEAVEPHFPDGFVEPPPSLDYREKGVVTPVKNQGDLGICYIFSAIGNIESVYALKHQQCVSLSEQQCLDCLPDMDIHGGNAHKVMQKLAEDKAGCMKEEDYPYQQKKGSCKEDPKKKIVTVLGGQELNIANEEALQQTLIQYGPLAVGLHGNCIGSYRKGIFLEDCHGSPTHEVLLVGYGEEDGKKFWIIKNSWGVGWGEEGYVRILRGVNSCDMGTSYTATAQVS